MPDFPVIWLSPVCQRCRAKVETLWCCNENVFEPCADCGRQPRRYVLADGEQWEPEADA